MDNAQALQTIKAAIKYSNKGKSAQENTYACYWVSPRGFANEGTYYHGTLEDCRKQAEPYRDDVNSSYTLISKHRTPEAAQARAEKEVRRMDRGRGWGEQNYTSAEAA